ncbi:increased loss of mitochondrial DNA protein 1 [Calycina marina]|uniref:Increased loss of mitochondrial DNA protein 1 n=1 Tax=Calycina marina TaxID=1763456 RepID=A0A9P8CIH7_9HELO|nr:increased loss of mitochondrial DNA protein 1 [Calycina marina]
MGIISGATIITSLSLFHITIAFFFLTSPHTMADQTLVWLIGSAMGMPGDRSFETKSAPLALLSAVLFVMGVSDLVAISLPEEISSHHWGSQAPVRLIVFFIICVYSHGFSDSSPLYTNSTYTPSSWGEGLKNNVVFTWAFLEMLTWFWVFLTLREERRELALRVQMKRASEENRL